MKVKELTKELSKYDPETEIVITTDFGEWGHPIVPFEPIELDKINKYVVLFAEDEITLELYLGQKEGDER